MEFEFTGTVYFDIDEIFETCRELNYIHPDDIYEAVRGYMVEMEDGPYYYVEGWMIDKVVTEVKKRIDKALEN